jgi:RHS repeat-associated protein
VYSASTSGTNYGWTYDANGNRLTQSGSNAGSYTIAGSSNQISSSTGAVAGTFTYDAAGHTASIAGVPLSYNQRGRLTSLNVNNVQIGYLYNALGQMIGKSVGSASTILVYDEAGHILGEYSPTSGLIQETVWLGDTPVATIQPTPGGSGLSIYYVHTDYLNTPRIITRPSDNTVMWAWTVDPFGTTAAVQNPEGAGNFVYNLRFPGQYYQVETGSFQNYYRDYFPSIGRYLESDPIGLKGGLNTYAYTRGNPINRSDRLGLDDSVCMFNPSMCGAAPPQPPPGDAGPHCGRCQGSDQWSYTPPAVCAAGDATCGNAMQSAGIPGPYYSTTQVLSRKCVLALLALAKPAGYFVSGQVGRQIALGTVLEYPAVAEAALGLTGPWSAIIAAPYALDELVKSCSCGK